MRVIELMEKLCEGNYVSLYQDAKSKKICIFCRKPADYFRDESSKLEYSVSAICQQCQDSLFKRTY